VEAVKEATQGAEVTVMGHFPNSILEDKSVFQEGVLLEPKPCLLGPEGQLIHQVANGPKNVYSHKRSVEGKIR
jgi:hypothetical protein